MSEVTEIVSTGSRHKPGSGHLRSPCPFHHSWQHLLPPLASILGPRPTTSSPPSAQVTSRCWLTSGFLPLKLHCFFLSASACHSSWGTRKGKVSVHLGAEAPPPVSSPLPQGAEAPPPVSSPLPHLHHPGAQKVHPPPTHPPAPSTQPSPEHHLTSWYSPPGRKLTLLLSAKRVSRAPTYTVLPSLLSRKDV